MNQPTPLQGTSFKHGWMERYVCMELFSNTTFCATLQRIFVDSEKMQLMQDE